MSATTLETQIVEACAEAALEIVMAYAMRFDGEEEFADLEDLAARVMYATSIAGTNIIRAEAGLRPITEPFA